MNRVSTALQAHRPSWPAVLLFTALLAQAPHAAAVFIRIAPHGAPWEVATSFIGAWVYAIALEGATAYFVWRSKLGWAIAFAVFSVAHNIAYYMPSAWTVDVYGATLEVRYIFSALLISASLPIAIAAFSHVQAKSAVETPAAPSTTKAPPQTPVAVPVGTLAPSGETPTAAEPPAEPELPQPDKKTQARQLRDEGYTPAEIARMLDAKYPTVQSWLRRSNAQTNGVQQ